MTLPADLAPAAGGGPRPQAKGAGGAGGWPALLSAASLPALTSGPRRIASLWAGYGEVLELQAGKHRLVAKRVAPPPSGGGGAGAVADVGHARKLRSYDVEAAFYRHYAPAMLADAQRGGPAEGCAIARPYLIQADGDDGGGGGGGSGGGGGGQGAVLLLLEDLRERFPRQPRSYGAEEAKRALEWLACFHAMWFESADALPSAGGRKGEGQQMRRRQQGDGGGGGGGGQESDQGGDREPDDADPGVPPLLWGSGCYWHLSTRLEELEACAQGGGEWAALAGCARDVDAALRGFGKGRRRFGTLCHGDAKAANFVFAERAAAAYDFQYVGGGYGPRDVAYLLCSSVDERALAGGGEERLLDHYREALLAALAKKKREKETGGRGSSEKNKEGADDDDDDPYPREALWRHYELALVDLCRFMAGWGWWGAARWAQRRARDILARLPALLEAERRSVLGE